MVPCAGTPCVPAAVLFTNQTERYEETLPLLQTARHLAERGDTELPTWYWVAAVEAEATSEVHHLASYHLFGAQAEFESDPIRERAWAGLAAAQASEGQGVSACIERERNRKVS